MPLALYGEREPVDSGKLRRSASRDLVGLEHEQGRIELDALCKLRWFMVDQVLIGYIEDQLQGQPPSILFLPRASLPPIVARHRHQLFEGPELLSLDRDRPVPLLENAFHDQP